MKKTMLVIGIMILFFMCPLMFEQNTQVFAAKAPLYYKYICQKCGYTIVVAKTNTPPDNQCPKGGKHRYKRTAVR